MRIVAAIVTLLSLLPDPAAAAGFDSASRLDRMESDLSVLLAHGPREAGTDAERFAAMYLERELGRLFPNVESEPVPLPNGLTSRNVWATLGQGRSHILLGAHYDSKAGSPGADDNGSGTVVLMEVARRLAAHPPRHVRVTIAFFGAEEILTGYGPDDHHFGSRLRAGRLAATEDLPTSMVSVDMVGFDDRLLAAVFQDTDPAAAMGVVRSGGLLSPPVPVELSRRGDISDHEPFARAGVPAVMLWRPENPNYHGTGDDRVVGAHLLDDLAVVEALLGYSRPAGSSTYMRASRWGARAW